jgi:hypothetical protein
MLRCCDGFACWKSRIRQIGDFDSKDAERSLCTNTVDLQPRCQQLITPQQVIELVERYHSAHLIVASGPTVTVGPEVLSLASEGRQCSESEKQRMAITLFDPITEDTAALVADRYLEVAMPRYPETSSGRGIVIVGGGIKYYPSAWVCINMLRKNGCTLPIELWHLGSAEMTLEMEALLRPLGVTCIDTNKVREKYHCKPLGGWETKAYALMFCSFESVLLLDADNVPLVNPEYLFETKEFIENGAVFWPDYGRLGADRKIWRICDVEYRDEPEFESGQILVNKRVCWKSLSLAMWYNLHSEFFYQYVHGDKETFHLAFRKTKKAYSMPNYGIHPLYATMCQHDFEGNRIFQHRNLAKWNLYQNLRIQGFEAEDECLRFIDALRTMWSGKIFCGQFDFSTAKSAVFADALEVVATRWCYERVGYDKRLIRLQLNGLVGVGADRCESAWGMEVNGKCIELLLFCVDGTVTCRFVKDSMGVWSGRWINHEQMEVRLLAAGDLCEPFAI